MHCLIAISAILLQMFIGISLSQALALRLNLTAIANVDGNSTIQCWQLSKPLMTPTTGPFAGTAQADLGPLGHPINALWSGSPAGVTVPFPGPPPVHPTPAVEYNILFSGNLTVTSPATNQTAVIPSGANGLIIIADIGGSGHTAVVTADNVPSVSIAIPIHNNTAPEHIVLHDGQCTSDEMIF